MIALIKTYPARFDTEVGSIADIPPVDPAESTLCNWGSGADCAADNELRARWAGAAVKTYAELTGGLENEPPETVVGDLLNDLRHLCDALDLDFDYLAGRSIHYDAELYGTF